MTPEVADELQDLVSTRAAELGVPGVAVGVVGDGFEHRCCVGHPTPGDPRPVDAETLFQIGSVSKLLTSLVVASLDAEDRLGPSTPLGELLDGSGLPDVTIGDLLNHRFGLDGDALLSRPPDPPTPAGAVIALATAEPLGAPGADFSYSNAAYSVLGRIIEVCDDRPFAESLRRRLTRPLRMRKTMTTADEAITGSVALPHQSHPEGPEPIPGGMGWQPRWELGAHDTAPAGVISCLDDLLRLAGFLLGTTELPRPPLDPTRVAASWRPVVEVQPHESMAAGWFVRSVGATNVVGHPGVTAGYCSLLSLVPERRTGWVVLTNGTAGGRLHGEIEELLLDRLLGIEPSVRDHTPSGDPAATVGTYTGGLGSTSISLTADAVHLHLAHAPRDDGRWQPFPDPPAEVVRRGDVLVGTDDHGAEVVVPLVLAPDDAVTAIRWGRRLRVRSG